MGLLSFRFEFVKLKKNQKLKIKLQKCHVCTSKAEIQEK